MHWEIFPNEWSKTYVTKEPILVDIQPAGLIAVFCGFKHDADSLVPNISETDDELPMFIVPTVHDFIYTHRTDAWGQPVSRWAADKTYHNMCKASTNKWRRRCAWHRYYLGVRPLGYFVWKRRKRATPIPKEKWGLYGTNHAAITARSEVERVVIEDGRLKLLPPEIDGKA